MSNIPRQPFDQPRHEENQNAALDKEGASEMMPQNENPYSKLVSSLGGIVWEADGKTFQYTFVSPQAEHILGYPVEQWTNEPNFWRNRLHPDDVDWCATSRLDAIAQRRDHEFTYRMIAADGRVVWLQDIVSVKIEAGESARLRGIMIDITEHKSADEALAESETRFRTIFENSGSGMALVDMQGHPIESNPALQKLLGYTEEELSSMVFTEFTHVDDRELDWALYNELVAGKRDKYEIEKRFITKDGRIICGNLIVSLVRDAEGTPKYAVGMVQDITKRKQAEEDLRRTSERLQLATRAAGIGIWDWDVVKDELIWDDAMYGLSGIRKEDFSGAYDVWAKFLAPEDFESANAEVQAALRGEREFAAEFRIVWPDSSTRFIKAASQTFHDEEGHPLRMVGINYDITKRKRAEEELRLSQERFFKTFHASPVAVVLARLEDGRLIEVNEAAQRYFGFSREEMIGRTTVELGIWGNAGSRQPRVEELEKLGSVREHEYEFRTKQGEVLIGLYSSELVEIGEVKCIQTVVQDITEHKHLEEQLRQSQKMEAIGRLAGGIAHDFNNLLTVIMGYSDLTLRRLEPENPLRRNIEEIKKAVERAASLTRQLLAFSRKQVLQPKVLNLNVVVSDMEKMLRRLIGEDIELRTVLASELGSVKADPGQIEQVIMNLVVNARDAMLHGGNLIIETENVYLNEAYATHHIGVKPGAYVMLAVSDTGEGMNEETQSRIFEPFFTTKELGKGTGLGLSTVYGIVKQSGGNIWLYSEVGAGTVFKVYLPRVDEVAQEYKQKHEIEEFLDGTEIILLTEDDERVRSLVRSILGGYGYQVLEAEDGDAALSLSERHEGLINLLLTDVVMPKMSGRELADQLAQSRPEMKVLYMSGYTDDSILHHGVLDADTPFIQKPFEPEALARKVRELLDEEAHGA